MSQQPDSIGTGGNLGAQRIKNYNPDAAYYAPGDIVMGTDGNLWRLTWLDGHGYWQRLPVLNVETMKLEPLEVME